MFSQFQSFTAADVHNRASAIIAFCRCEGFTPARDPMEVARLELIGLVVDLRTGRIVGTDNARYEPTEQALQEARK